MHEPPWVAIIDDDEAVRKSTIRLLRHTGIPAVGFCSAEEFLQWSSGSEPGCLVLDIHLGSGLNGFELRQRLESDGRPLPIVFVTGRPDDPLLKAQVPDWVADVLSKPFEAHDLYARVRRHVRSAPGPIPS